MGEPGITLEADAPIFLVGFMGAGKTTVGRALARQLQWGFLDLDDLIEQRAGRSVQAIFADSGEPAFRRLEVEALESCRGLVRTVIALGGGAYVSEENRATLRGIGKTIWLECPLEICLQRVSGDGTRPLLGDEDEMNGLLDQRRSAYAAADITVQSGYHSAEQIAAEITNLLGPVG
jgi:shikimate kinase